jgi:hypothetical protein
MDKVLQLPGTRTWGHIALRRAFFFAAFFLAFSVAAFAQTTDGAWEEEDDEFEEDEPTEEKALIDDRPIEKKAEVTITLDGEVFDWKDEIIIQRGDTIDISVRDLAPASRVEIIAEKGGINLTRKVFWANNQGELDLEVRIGSKRMKGKANLIYTPSGAPKKEKENMVIVE